MPALFIIWDPDGCRVKMPPEEYVAKTGILHARLDLPDGIDGRDRYEVARRLAELLLEQVQ